MGVLPFTVVLTTVTLTAAIPKFPGAIPRQQQVTQYFPDFRYPDPMENPQFMTAKCMSEGVFPHPYNCTWFYRCHDRIGRGYFFTSYFMCERGTEFDDDLDQCIPKSGTCGDEKDIHFCRTLRSSCRSCNVGGSQQELCEYKECYSGGRDAGIQRMCKEGQLHNGETCVDVSNCPMREPPQGECPLNKLRPTAKWTDQASGCSEYTGCRAGKNYQESLCSSYYDCPGGVKVQRYCPEGYYFSEQWKLCIQPPQENPNCEIPPPPTPPKCYPSQGLGDTCQQYSGCLNGQTREITQTLCDYYRCTSTGSQKFSCPGADQVFNRDTQTCQKMLSSCKPECVPENAVGWESCTMKSGCRFPDTERHSELLCGEYTCSDRNNLRPCGPGQLFNVTSKSCVADLTPCLCLPNTAQFWEDCDTCGGLLCQTYRCYANGENYRCQNGQLFSHTKRDCVDPIEGCVPCTASNAQFWGECDTVTGCTPNGLETTAEVCQHFKCSANGEEYRCQNGQVFSPTRKVCVDPIGACPCTEARAEFWSDCIDVDGCIDVTPDQNQTQQQVFVVSQRSQVVQTKACQKYYCVNNGPEFSCDVGMVFDPNLKACITPLVVTECPCTADRAEYWEECNEVTGCTYYSPLERTDVQCQIFSCSFNGSKVSCQDGEVFSALQESCVTPLNDCPCTVDQASFWEGCEFVTGCSANNQVERTDYQCQNYSCSITGPQFSCPDGQIFSQEQKACVEPLNVASCPCTVDQANFWGDCEDVTGCSANNQYERTERQCQYYSCSISGADLRCPGGQVFNPAQRACVEPLNVASCPCTVDRARFWGDCEDITGCSTNNQIERTERQCQTYSCSITGSEFRCPGGQIFSPEQKACVEPLNVARCPCTENRANFWSDCEDVTGCSTNNQIERTEKQCQTYSCSVTGSEFRCQGGQVFSPTQRSCVEPLNVASCPCTEDRANFWSDCEDVTGCSTNNQIERTEKQCQTYSCSLTGSEFRCRGGQIFSPTQRACVEPLNAASCPCTENRAQFWGECDDVTGCTEDNQIQRTVRQCQHYSCSSTGIQISCQFGYVFSPEQRACVEPLDANVCPVLRECGPSDAHNWDRCTYYCDTPGERTEMCGRYTCYEGDNSVRKYCPVGQLFSTQQKDCVTAQTTYCPRSSGSGGSKKGGSVAGLRANCAPDNANWWHSCSTKKACVADRYPQQLQTLCEKYSCGQYGSEFSCIDGQKYDAKKAACVTPLKGKYCLEDISLQHHQVTFNTWNYQVKGGVDSSAESYFPTLQRLVNSLQTVHGNSFQSKV